MRLAPIVLLSVFSIPLSSQPPQIGPLRTYTSDAARAAAHASPDWALVEPHLPDPKTASPQVLETEADVLRARRFPEDALDYYGYAIERGGDIPVLLNKIGVTELEIGNAAIAREFFQRAVKMHKNDAQAWNNLGAVDFLDKEYLGAARSYKRAIKLDKRSAVSHSNLGLTYVQLKDYDSARRELAFALKLDPAIFQHSSGAGVSLHMLSTGDRAEFALEMAKVYARSGNETEMIHSLGMAAESGMDVQFEMGKDHDLAPFVHDPRIIQIVETAKSLRDRNKGKTNIAAALPPADPNVITVR
jgi:tetratricopeptide (TPR) repeat protein